MATLVSEEYEPIPVKEMSYDEFCIAAFGKDAEELRKEYENNKQIRYYDKIGKNQGRD